MPTCSPLDPTDYAIDAQPCEGMTLNQALTWVKRRLPPIGKTSRAPGRGGEGLAYAYRSIEDILAVARPLLVFAGINYFPWVEIERVEHSLGMKDMWTDTQVGTTWTIIGPSGDIRYARTTGIGRDNSDKGSNKGQTQSEKYLLIPLLNIGENASDPDAHNTEAGEDEDPWTLPAGRPGRAPHDRHPEALQWWSNLGWEANTAAEARAAHDARYFAARERAKQLVERGRADLAAYVGKRRPPFEEPFMTSYERFVHELLEAPSMRVQPEPVDEHADPLAAIEADVPASPEGKVRDLMGELEASLARAKAEREATDDAPLTAADFEDTETVEELMLGEFEDAGDAPDVDAEEPTLEENEPY